MESPLHDFERRKLDKAAYLASLEVPDCKCKIPRIHDPLCPKRIKHVKGCRQRGKIHPTCDCPPNPYGKCDCLLDMSAKCEHVLAVDHDIPIEEWEEMLREFYPEEFGERPEPVERTDMLPGPYKVEVLAERQDGEEGLRRQDDARFEDCPKIGRQGERFSNGAKAGPQLRFRAEGTEVA